MRRDKLPSHSWSSILLLALLVIAFGFYGCQCGEPSLPCEQQSDCDYPASCLQGRCSQPPSSGSNPTSNPPTPQTSSRFQCKTNDEILLRPKYEQSELQLHPKLPVFATVASTSILLWDKRTLKLLDRFVRSPPNRVFSSGFTSHRQRTITFHPTEPLLGYLAHTRNAPPYSEIRYLRVTPTNQAARPYRWEVHHQRSPQAITPKYEPVGLQFSSDGSYLIVYTQENIQEQQSLYIRNRLEFVTSITHPEALKERTMLDLKPKSAEPMQSIWDVWISPDSRWVAVAHQTDTYLWKIEEKNGKFHTTFKNTISSDKNSPPIRGVQFSSQREEMYVIRVSDVLVYNLNRGERSATLKLNENPKASFAKAALHQGSQTLIVWESFDNKVHHWDLNRLSTPKTTYFPQQSYAIEGTQDHRSMVIREDPQTQLFLIMRHPQAGISNGPDVIQQWKCTPHRLEKLADNTATAASRLLAVHPKQPYVVRYREFRTNDNYVNLHLSVQAYRATLKSTLTSMQQAVPKEFFPHTTEITRIKARFFPSGNYVLIGFSMLVWNSTEMKQFTHKALTLWKVVKSESTVRLSYLRGTLLQPESDIFSLSFTFTISQDETTLWVWNETNPEGKKVPKAPLHAYDLRLDQQGIPRLQWMHSYPSSSNLFPSSWKNAIVGDYTLSLSPNGQWMLGHPSYTSGGALLWKRKPTQAIATQLQLVKQQDQPQTNNPSFYTFGPNNRWLLRDHPLGFDLTDLSTQQTQSFLQDSLGLRQVAAPAVFHPTGKTIVSQTLMEDGRVRLTVWDRNTKKPLQHLPGGAHSFQGSENLHFLPHSQDTTMLRFVSDIEVRTWRCHE